MQGMTTWKWSNFGVGLIPGSLLHFPEIEHFATIWSFSHTAMADFHRSRWDNLHQEEDTSNTFWLCLGSVRISGSISGSRSEFRVISVLYWRLDFGIDGSTQVCCPHRLLVVVLVAAFVSIISAFSCCFYFKQHWWLQWQIHWLTFLLNVVPYYLLLFWTDPMRDMSSVSSCHFIPLLTSLSRLLFAYSWTSRWHRQAIFQSSQMTLTGLTVCGLSFTVLFHTFQLRFTLT